MTAEIPKLTTHLNKIVNSTNIARCLLMRGLPWKVQAEDVVKHLDGLIEAKDVHLEQYNGRRTGMGIVTFNSTKFAQMAKAKY